jgi:hypothetical protein
LFREPELLRRHLSLTDRASTLVESGVPPAGPGERDEFFFVFE